MRKILLTAVLGISGILFIEYQMQQHKNKITVEPKLNSQSKLKKVDNKTSLPTFKKVISENLNSVDIDKKIEFYNKKLSRFASLNFEEFSENQLKQFSQLNIERAELLRRKVLLKYRKM
jgi:hypothetical protein